MIEIVILNKSLSYQTDFFLFFRGYEQTPVHYLADRFNLLGDFSDYGTHTKKHRTVVKRFSRVHT